MKIKCYQVRIHHLRMNNSGPFSKFTMLSPSTSSRRKETSYESSIPILGSCPSLLPAPTVLTSLRISLFRIFHLQRVTQDMIFGTWLLSLSVIFSRFIRVVALLHLHSFSWLNTIPVCDYNTFCFSVHQSVAIGLTPSFGYYAL